MLLITRRSGEAIVINGTIEVKVLEVKSGRVKLGFEYPPGSSVFRQELFAKIQDENKAAAARAKLVRQQTLSSSKMWYGTCILWAKAPVTPPTSNP